MARLGEGATGVEVSVTLVPPVAAQPVAADLVNVPRAPTAVNGVAVLREAPWRTYQHTNGPHRARLSPRGPSFVCARARHGRQTGADRPRLHRFGRFGVP